MKGKIALSVFALASVLAACASEAGRGTDPTTGAEDEALATSKSPKYFTLRPNFWLGCSPRTCSGYWLQEVNHEHAREVLVARLDFAQSGLSEQDVALVERAPATELLLRGVVVREATNSERLMLSVREAYRGMPGIGRADEQAFYRVADVCDDGSCEGEIASLLDRHDQTEFATFDLARIDHRVQLDWLVLRLRGGGAIARGWLGPLPACGDGPSCGTAHALSATQVYLRIPERYGPCPMSDTLPMPICPEGTVMSFTRTANRCMFPTGCVMHRICPFTRPTCSEGYTKIAWVSKSSCEASVCDPSWVTER